VDQCKPLDGGGSAEWGEAKRRAVTTVRTEEKQQERTGDTRNGDGIDGEVVIKGGAEEVGQGVVAAAEEEEDKDTIEEGGGGGGGGGGGAGCLPLRSDFEAYQPEAASESEAASEAEEAAVLNLGEGAVVDDRLLRVFELLSGDAEMAEAAVRLRAGQLLQGVDSSDDRVDSAGSCDDGVDAAEMDAVAVGCVDTADTEAVDSCVDTGDADAAAVDCLPSSEAAQLAARYRARRKALLLEIV
jgi:hypothetical protein